MTETIRRQNSQSRVLDRLQKGSATSVELNEICFRYGARIHELRSLGYNIVRKSHTDGNFLYTLEKQ
jgi:hypothetical protein